MKKVLTVLGLMFLLGATSVQAAPMGPAMGHHGGHMAPPPAHNMHHVTHHRGHHMMPPPPRHHHRSHVVVGGYYPRRDCWGYTYYDYALGYDRCYYTRPYYDSGVYFNVGFPIRF